MPLSSQATPTTDAASPASGGSRCTRVCPRNGYVALPVVGVIGAGNRNFGEHYQAVARDIARRSRRPVLWEFELLGTPDDVEE